MTLLLEGDLLFALEIHRKTYLLVRWLEEAIASRLIAPELTHEINELEPGALGWLERHRGMLPAEILVDRTHLREQAEYLTTVVDGTFEFRISPGEMLNVLETHCSCRMCRWIVRQPYLRTRKVGAHDKQEADRMQLEYLRQLALDFGLDPNKPSIERLAENRSYRDIVALCTYAADLTQRIRGRNSGAASLALWRRFAWTEEGSPKKEFELRPGDILEAQQRLLDQLGLEQV